MLPRKRLANEPRPQCPECGCVVGPRSAVVYRLPPKDSRVHYDLGLIGLYCRSDCLLNAFLRRWPFWRVKGVGG